jgi:hypothetical protein
MYINYGADAPNLQQVRAYLGKRAEVRAGGKYYSAAVAGDGTITLSQATGRQRPVATVYKTTDGRWSTAAKAVKDIFEGRAPGAARTGASAGPGAAGGAAGGRPGAAGGRAAAPGSGKTNTAGVANVANKLAAKSNADAKATEAEVKTAKTAAEKRALTDKMLAQRKAAAAAAAVKKAAQAGGGKALQDALTAQRKAEEEKRKAEAKAKKEALEAQRKAEKVAAALPPYEGKRMTDAQMRAARQSRITELSRYVGKKVTSAKNGRTYDIQTLNNEPVIAIYEPDGGKRTLTVDSGDFAVTFQDFLNALAVANLRTEVVVQTTGSTTGDVVTTQDVAVAVVEGGDTFVPSGVDTVAGSTDGTTVVSASDTAIGAGGGSTSTDTSTSGGGGGQMRVTEETTGEYVPDATDALPQASDAEVIRMSETALASEAQAVVDAATTDAATSETTSEAAPSDATTVSTTVPAGEESFLVKYKWPLVGAGILVVAWALKNRQ